MNQDKERCTALASTLSATGPRRSSPIPRGDQADAVSYAAVNPNRFAATPERAETALERVPRDERHPPRIVPDIDMRARGGESAAGELRDHLGLAVALQADARAQLPVVRQRGARPARSARPSESRGSAAKRNSAITSLIMPTSGRRISPSTSRPPGFSSRRITANAESSSAGVMYWATEFMTARSIDFSSIFRKSSSERTLILVFGRKTRDQPAAHARRGLRQIQLAAGLRHPCGGQRFAAGIIQHHRVRRGDVADDVPAISWKCRSRCSLLA